MDLVDSIAYQLIDMDVRTLCVDDLVILSKCLEGRRKMLKKRSGSSTQILEMCKSWKLKKKSSNFLQIYLSGREEISTNSYKEVELAMMIENFDTEHWLRVLLKCVYIPNVIKLNSKKFQEIMGK